MTNAIRTIAATAVWNYLAIALSFALNVVVSRSLGPDGYGRLAILMTAAQILLFLVSHWSITGVVHFAARESAAVGIVSETLWARTLLVAPALLLAVAALLIF